MNSLEDKLKLFFNKINIDIFNEISNSKEKILTYLANKIIFKCTNEASKKKYNYLNLTRYSPNTFLTLNYYGKIIGLDESNYVILLDNMTKPIEIDISIPLRFTFTNIRVSEKNLPKIGDYVYLDNYKEYKYSKFLLKEDDIYYNFDIVNNDDKVEKYDATLINSKQTIDKLYYDDEDKIIYYNQHRKIEFIDHIINNHWEKSEKNKCILNNINNIYLRNIDTFFSELEYCKFGYIGFHNMFKIHLDNYIPIRCYINEETDLYKQFILSILFLVPELNISEIQSELEYKTKDIDTLIDIINRKYDIIITILKEQTHKPIHGTVTKLVNKKYIYVYNYDNKFIEPIIFLYIGSDANEKSKTILETNDFNHKIISDKIDTLHSDLDKILSKLELSLKKDMFFNFLKSLYLYKPVQIKKVWKHPNKFISKLNNIDTIKDDILNLHELFKLIVYMILLYFCNINLFNESDLITKDYLNFYISIVAYNISYLIIITDISIKPPESDISIKPPESGISIEPVEHINKELHYNPLDIGLELPEIIINKEHLLLGNIYILDDIEFRNIYYIKTGQLYGRLNASNFNELYNKSEKKEEIIINNIQIDKCNI